MTDFRQEHPNGVILALDQMSLYFQATLTRVWAPIGETPQVRVASQRQYVNFYGALDVLSGHEIALSLPRQNSEMTVHFLKHILTCLPGRRILCELLPVRPRGRDRRTRLTCGGRSVALKTARRTGSGRLSGTLARVAGGQTARSSPSSDTVPLQRRESRATQPDPAETDDVNRRCRWPTCRRKWATLGPAAVARHQLSGLGTPAGA